MSFKVIKMNQIQNKFKSLSQVIGTMTLVMGLFLTTTVSTAAAEETQYDDVFINGYELGYFEQMALEDFMGHDIADGSYWFELDTGVYGRDGGPAMGHITVPEEYQEFVKSKFSKKGQTVQVELSASADDCDSCMYW